MWVWDVPRTELLKAMAPGGQRRKSPEQLADLGKAGQAPPSRAGAGQERGTEVDQLLTTSGESGCRVGMCVGTWLHQCLL